MTNNIDEIINKKRDNQEVSFLKFGLKYNPFPKSGTANTHESSDITKLLVPVETDIQRKLHEYVADSLFSSNEEDHKLICTITGDYGTGKTQMLLYTKCLIQSQYKTKNAFVVYINNPGTKLSELIGQVIENIGQEQFKKYLWDHIIKRIKSEDNTFKNELNKLSASPPELFSKSDPFSVENQVNHKAFLDAFLNLIQSKDKRKVFNDRLKQIIISILKENTDDEVIADYFYNIVSEDFGINKTWETITAGSGQYLEQKVVKLLNAIINVIYQQDFKRFYILVDEFEDIHSARLTKKEVDNYSHNLRTLIDKERRWCLMIAMTAQALIELKKASPPLVDRLTDREIRILRLSSEQTLKIVSNYLKLARDNSSDENYYPFTKESIEHLNSISKGLTRMVLRQAYYLLERADSDLLEGQVITKEFIDIHLSN